MDSLRLPGGFAAAWLAPVLLVAPVVAQNPATAPGLGAASRTPARVAVLVADAADVRVRMVGEAATFWNETVSDLGLPAAFAEPLSATPPSGLRPFENYAHQLSQLAGRLHSSAPGPAPPPALLGLDAEVVVLLSAQALMPFAWPYTDDGRHFVAVPAGDERDHVVRNVIAHELGHVLGLKHVREPGVLMCQPCDTSAAAGGGDGPRFLPLTDIDRERLRAFLGRSGP